MTELTPTKMERNWDKQQRNDMNEMEDQLEWEKVFISQLHECETEIASSNRTKKQKYLQKNRGLLKLLINKKGTHKNKITHM